MVAAASAGLELRFWPVSMRFSILVASPGPPEDLPSKHLVIGRPPAQLRPKAGLGAAGLFSPPLPTLAQATLLRPAAQGEQ